MVVGTGQKWGFLCNWFGNIDGFLWLVGPELEAEGRGAKKKIENLAVVDQSSDHSGVVAAEVVV